MTVQVAGNGGSASCITKITRPDQRMTVFKHKRPSEMLIVSSSVSLISYLL